MYRQTQHGAARTKAAQVALATRAARTRN